MAKLEPRIVKIPNGEKEIRTFEFNRITVPIWDITLRWMEYGETEWEEEVIYSLAHKASYGNLAVRYFNTINSTVEGWEKLHEENPRYFSLDKEISRTEKKDNQKMLSL